MSEEVKMVGKRRWPKILGMGLAAVVVLGIAGYLAVTSAWFLRSFVVPKVEEALGAHVTIGDASIHPFSSVTLSALKVDTGVGGEPLLSVKEVRIRYRLRDILDGYINVAEFVVDTPIVTLEKKTNGTTSMDPILKKLASTPSKPSQPGPPPRVNLEKISVLNGSVRYKENLAQGGARLVELGGLNLTVTGIANDQQGRVELGAALKFDQGLNAPSNGVLEARFNGAFDVKLDRNLALAGAKGGLKLEPGRVAGVFQDLAGGALALDVDMTPTEVKALRLGVSRDGKQLGTISASGPLDTVKGDGKLKIEVSGVDKQMLNLAGAVAGLDFNTTVLNSSADVELKQWGQWFDAKGVVEVSRFSVTRQGQTSPPLNIKLNYDTAVDLKKKTAQLKAVNLVAVQNQNEVLQAALAKPMQIMWAGAANAVEESAFNLTVRNLELADWRAFVPDYAPAGRLQLVLKLSLQQAGRIMDADGEAQVAGFSMRQESNRFECAGIALKTRCRIDDFGNKVNFEKAQVQLSELSARLGTNAVAFATLTINNQGVIDRAAQKASLELSGDLSKLKARWGTNDVDLESASVAGKLALSGKAFGQVELRDYDLRLGSNGRTVLASSGTLQLNQDTQDASWQGRLSAELPQLVAFAADVGLKAASGAVKFEGQAAQKNLNPGQTNKLTFDRQLAGKLQLTDWSGSYKEFNFDRFGVSGECDVAIKEQALDVRKFTAAFRQAGQDAGTLEASGRMDLASTNGQLNLKVVGVNQHLLQSAAYLLAPNKLETISLNAQTTMRFDSKGESDIKGELQVSDLLITDPKGQLPRVPMTASANLDVGIKNQVAEVRQLIGAVRQGQLSGGRFDIKATYDMARTNGQVAIKLDDLNQNVLRPFLGAALGSNSLVSVSISADVAGRFDAAGEGSLKGSMNVTNLLVKDPEGKLPKTPLAVGLTLDGTMSKKVLDLRQFVLALAPTQRASNKVALSGKLDLNRSNAITGSINLSGDALDLTPYYDLLAATPGASNSTATVPVVSNEEPPPLLLPLTNFTFNAAIGRLYLREIDVANTALGLRIDGGKVAVNNLQFAINGAPVNGRGWVDLGRPGYAYDVGLKSQKVPLAPFINSFAPDLQGLIKGDLTSDLAVSGQGTKGYSLKKSLNGQFVMELNTAEVRLNQILDQGKLKWVKPVFIGLAVTLGMPDLISRPLDQVKGNLQFGGGNIQVKEMMLRSPNFIMETAGVIPIADVLTNSPVKQPVTVYLARDRAGKYIMRDTPANTTHIRLPDFMSLAGTLGEIKPKFEAAKLAAGTALTILGDKLDKKDGGLIQGVGGLLGIGGAKAVQKDQPAATNAPPASTQRTNPPVIVIDPFKLLKPKK